jgi:hypothetical protein
VTFQPRRRCPDVPVSPRRLEVLQLLLHHGLPPSAAAALGVLPERLTAPHPALAAAAGHAAAAARGTVPVSGGAPAAAGCALSAAS